MATDYSLTDGAETPEQSLRSDFIGAVAAYQRGDVAEAIGKLREILSSHPGHVEAQELTGVILLSKGEFAASFQMLKLVTQAKPLDVISQFRLAEAAERIRHENCAADAYRRAEIAEPNSSAVQLRLLSFHAAHGRGASARKHASRNIIVGDLSSLAFSIRAKLQFGAGDPGTVRDDLMRSLIIAPANGADMYPLAQILEKTSDTNRAEKLYRKFCKVMGPLDARGWGALYDLLSSRRRRKEGTAFLKRALILSPAEPAFWSRMSGADWSHPDPSFAATAAAMSGSPIPAVWMQVLLSLASKHDMVHLAKRAAEAMRRVNLEARSSPSIRFSLAEMTFVNGDKEEARRQLQLFFSEVSAGLEDARQEVKHDFGCIVFLYFLLFSGAVEECARFADRLHSDFGGNSNTQIHFNKLKLLLGLVTGYRTRPHIWSSERRRVVSLPVWGAKYVTMWLKYGLPSLFGEENRKFWDEGETVFHVATTPEDWSRLNADPLFERFCKRHSPKFLDVTPILKSGLQAGSYQALTLAHWASISIARDENAEFVGLVADYIFSDGSMSFIADQVQEADMQAAFTVDFWVAGEAATPVFDSLLSDDGTLSISAQRMMQVFSENSSARIHFNEAGRGLGSIPSDPSRIYNRLPNGLRIDNLQPQLFFATPEFLRDVWLLGLPMTDNGLVDLVFTGEDKSERCRILVDPHRFGCVVLDFDEEERAATGHYPERLQSVDPEADLADQILRSSLWSPGRRWALENPLYVSFDGEPPDRTEADRFMAAVRTRLPVPRLSGNLAMVHELGREEFARFWTQREAAERE
ncbi:tetratricopeptide repeat protein [Nisaea acidiphila]|uniref:Tetratricopeptide repeat protein n=1 Tax=Nisaea acidiphila TaxID=1862145 RepID=A0A9J7AXY1_9PROT|nr:tetratricopeptide repeat protein [Nisaea acidiphila]UUX51658.1 tetratricopeptide repeat protein [Nisaea acidiphila]